MSEQSIDIDDDDDADPVLDHEDRAAVAALTPADVAEIDRAILAQLSVRWQKTAMVVMGAMDAWPGSQEHIPDVFYGERIIALARDGLIESNGDLGRMRSSEVRASRKTRPADRPRDQQRNQAKVKSSLTARLPKHSGDVDAARKLVALGYPEVAPVLPHLLQWLETNGSPVELVLRPFFAELGAPARDLACKALLHPNKPALKRSLLRDVLPSWPRDVVATLPLEGYLYNSGDGFGLDVWALKLMMDMRIPTHDGLEGLIQVRDFKIARLEAHLAVLANLALPAHSA